jgi:hypothetical protein
MLKPADPTPPTSDRPIGELFRELVDDGKAYARAEVNVAKTIASEKANAFKVPAILFAAALFIGMAAINVFAITVFVGLALIMHPVLAGLVAFLIVAGLAGLLAYIGAQKLRSAP